jgi:hypothetical protein
MERTQKHLHYTRDIPMSEANMLVDALNRLERELAETDKLNAIMADILTATANAIKGKPEILRSHSWHDLAEKVAEARKDAERYRWVRSHPTWESESYLSTVTPAQFDADVDAMMAIASDPPER